MSSNMTSPNMTELGYCPAPNCTFVTNIPPKFVNTPVIRDAHLGAPRYGHIRQIIKVIIGTPQEQQSYLIGLIAGAITMCCFFVVWLLVIIVLRCLGYKRVGFFSGHPVERPEPPAGMENYKQPDDRLDQVQSERKEDLEQSELTEGKEQSELEEELEQKERDEDQEQHELKADLGQNAREDQQSELNEDLEQDGSEFITTNPQEAGKIGQDDDCATPAGQEAADDGFQEIDQLPEDAVVEGDPGAAAPTTEQVEEWQKEVARRERRLKRIRIVCLLCAFSTVICVILMCTKGVGSLVGSLNNGRQALLQAEGLATQAIDLIDNFTTVQENLLEQVDGFKGQWNVTCPKVQKAICDEIEKNNITDIDICDDYANIPLGEYFSQLLNQGTSYVFGKLYKVRRDSERLQDMFHSLYERTGRFYWAFWVAAAFAILLGVLNLLLATGIVMAWRGQLKGNLAQKFLSCIRNWFVLPLYAFLVFMSFVFSMVFVIGSTATADFCYDSPDPKLIELLKSREQEFQKSIFYHLTLFYLNGCPPDKAPPGFEQEIQVLRDLHGVLMSVSTDNPDKVEEYCSSGPGTALAIQGILFAVGLQACSIATSLCNVQNFFSCDNWHPVYRSAVYNAVCYSGTEGFVYIAATQTAVIFISMIMLTLRVGFYEITDEEDEATRQRCWNKCFGRFRKNKHVAEKEVVVNDDDAVQEGQVAQEGEAAQQEHAEAC